VGLFLSTTLRVPFRYPSHCQSPAKHTVFFHRCRNWPLAMELLLHIIYIASGGFFDATSGNGSVLNEQQALTVVPRVLKLDFQRVSDWASRVQQLTNTNCPTDSRES